MSRVAQGAVARVDHGLRAERPRAIERAVDVAAGILAEARRIEMLEVELRLEAHRLREAQASGSGGRAAVGLGNVHPHESERVERLAHRVGEAPVVIILRGIDMFLGERTERVEYHRQAFPLFR